MSNIKLIKKIMVGSFIFLLVFFNFIYGANSQSYPVTATYCDGSTLDIYPFSFVTRTDGSTFNCYEVLANPIQDGYSYGFEDKDDADYDDLIVDLWVTGNHTSSPVLQVKFVSKEASYKHWLYVVYGGTQQLVFKAEDSSPGAVYSIALPVKTCADFEVKADPPQRTIDQGDSTHYTVTVKAMGGFSDDTNLTVEGLPSGASGVFQPNPLPVTGEAKLDIFTTPQVPVGIYTLTITGTAGASIRSTQVLLEIKEKQPPEPDFTITTTTLTRTVIRGNITHYNIYINPLNGFSGSTHLKVEGLPQKTRATFQPNPVNPNVESKLRIFTREKTPVGSYTLTITGTSGNISHSIDVTLEVMEEKVVLEPDFTIAVEPASRTVVQGQVTDYQVTVSAVYEFAGEVGFKVEGLPTGAAAEFQPNTIQGGGESKCSITTAENTPVGTYTLTVTGTSGQISHSAEVKLEIEEIPPEPDFTLSAFPTGRTILRGESAEYTLKVTGLNDFSGQVTLSTNGLPTGCGGLLTPDTVTLDTNTDSGQSTLQVTTSAETPIGSHTFTVSAESGEIKHSVTLTLTLTCPGFSVQVKAEPLSGAAPLTVRFEGHIITQGEFPVSAYAFQWDFADGGTSNQQNPEHTFTAPGKYQVTLTVTDPCGQTRTGSVVIEVEGFEGAVTKSFSKAEALPGEEVFINIQVKNDTHFDFTNFIIEDELSPLLEYLEDSASVSPRRSGQELVWQLPRLGKGETISFNIKVKVSETAAPGTVTNTAYLSHDSLGPGQRIASNTASLSIYKIDVLLQKQVEETTARPGDMVKYQLMVKNNSNIPLTNIKLIDELSSHLEFISAVSGGFEHSRQSRQLLWEGTLEPNQQAVITFKARVRSNTFSGTRIENTAKLEAAELKEPITSNTVVTTVTAEPVATGKIRFTKRSEVPQTEIGRIIRFNITAVNMSNSTLISPVIEDHLPQGFNYVAQTTLLNNQRSTEPQGRRRLMWQLPAIKPGETVVLRFQVVIGADARRGRNINRATFRAVDNSGQDLFYEASAFVNVSTSGFIFYSGVEGTVYLDRDDDDFYSPSDTPLEGIEVRMSTGEKFITDSTGRYSFENLFPGEYAVGVNTATLPERYRLSSPYPKVVVLSDGLSDTVDFAVKFKGDDEVATARLEARVFYDKNQNLIFDNDDPLVQQFKAKLDNTKITTGSNGTFVFTHLVPGTHIIEIIYGPKTVTKEITLNKGKNFIDIPLKFTGIKIIVKGEEQ